MSEKNKTKILIVEDEIDFAKILSIKFEKEGYEVVVAQNGELGVNAAKELKPAIILMDVQMPVMNGFEAFFKLKEDPETKNIKVVFLTSYGEPAKDAAWLDEKYAREIGAGDYIRKTDSLDDIVKAVGKLLEG
ncbi:MAG: response regulator [bacterium]|nr:response regulator [bacterium]